MNVLIVIITTRKYHKTRLQNQLNTWLKDIPYLIISDKKTANTIKGADDYGYRSHVEKNLFAINMRIEYNWIAIFDDDTYVNYDNLLTELQKYSCSENIIIGEKIQSYKKIPELEYCSGGAGYVLSKKAAMNIRIYTEINSNNECATIKTNRNTYNIPINDNEKGVIYFADVLIGLICKDLGIRIIHNEKFHGQQPIGNIKEQVSFHYIRTAEQMKMLYENNINVNSI